MRSFKLYKYHPIGWPARPFSRLDAIKSRASEQATKHCFCGKPAMKKLWQDRSRSYVGRCNSHVQM